MRFDEYQEKAWSTATYPKRTQIGLAYVTLGLGESGEVQNKVKKLFRGDYKDISEKKDDIKKELGDILWYVAALCSELDLNMGDVATANIEKLLSRKERGTLLGDGDNR